MSKAKPAAAKSATPVERSADETSAGLLTLRSWHDGSAETSLPLRYDVREGEHGRYLRCKEAPGVGVAIDRSYAFSEAEARKLGERVILLDGAGQFGPLIDNSKLLYNLDHHDQCLRAFTLATCEQAMVLVLKGLELDKGDWRILANEPDLDTVFAIWVLLNHRRLRELDPVARDAIVPLLRLEGAIDANGYEIAEYCGLKHDNLVATKAQLDDLFGAEQELKKSGRWGEADLVEYTRDRLVEIDHLVYDRGDFEDFDSVEEELGHVDIGDGRVAVVVSDSEGIYEVERRLKKVWGDRLGIIALAKDRRHYTLRRAASLADIDLQAAYDWLNQLDPQVDGHPPEKKWGGSDDIGGSPRPTGTGLGPREIGVVLRRAYRAAQPGTLWQRAGRAALWTVVLGGLAALAGFAYERWSTFEGPIDSALRLVVVTLVILAGAIVGSLALTSRHTWQLGWRWPAGEGWVLLLPAVLLGAATGGVWLPRQTSWEADALIAATGSMVLAAVALELWFRGLMHGQLLPYCRIQLLGGRWFVSRPALLSALLYALLTVAASAVAWIAPPPEFWQPVGAIGMRVLPAAGAFVVGLALVMIRERSLSLLPAIGAMIAGGLARLALELF